ncbi:MAG: phosphoglycerate dehydrogenase [Candidatus Thermoplasmatota archaeon]
MTSKKKVIITPSSFGECGDEPLELLRQAHIDVILNPYHRKMKPDEVIELGKECQGIIAGVETLNQQVLSALPSVRCISRVGVGIDNIDIEYARRHGIIIKNTPDGPTRAVAELTVGLIFDLLRMISYRDRLIRQGIWNKDMGFLLYGKTVGIIGLGRIGKKVAEILQLLGVTVVGHDIHPDHGWCKQKNVQLLSLSDLLKKSDIVSVHVSKLPEGKPLLGKSELALMKKQAFLLNLSRGEILDEHALYEALKTQSLAGAALDVYTQEPYAGPLTELGNIILTPHIGSYAKESRLDMEIQAVKNLLEVLSEQ